MVFIFCEQRQNGVRRLYEYHNTVRSDWSLVEIEAILSVLAVPLYIINHFAIVYSKGGAVSAVRRKNLMRWAAVDLAPANYGVELKRRQFISRTNHYTKQEVKGSTRCYPINLNRYGKV